MASRAIKIQIWHRVLTNKVISRLGVTTREGLTNKVGVTTREGLTNKVGVTTKEGLTNKVGAITKEGLINKVGAITKEGGTNRLEAIEGVEEGRVGMEEEDEAWRSLCLGDLSLTNDDTVLC